MAERKLTESSVIADRFVVIRTLAEGRVFLCSDRDNVDHLYAVKLSPVSELKNTDHNLRREFILHSQVSSDHIVSLHDAFESEEYFGFSMNFIGGGDLADHLDANDKTDSEMAVQVLLEISSALAEVHTKNLVHGDIKPENILLSSDGKYLLTDFGLARDLRYENIPDGDTRGTLEYLAPEYLLDGVQSAASDVYSLGLVAFEMLTGSLPFQSENVMAMLQKRVSFEAPNLRNLDSNVLGALADVVSKALSIDPNERYKDGSEMYQELKSIAERTESLRQKSRTGFLKRLPRRRRQVTELHTWKPCEQEEKVA